MKIDNRILYKMRSAILLISFLGAAVRMFAQETDFSFNTSVDNLYTRGADCQSQNKVDSALTFYMTLVDNYKADLPADTKRLCALGCYNGAAICIQNETYLQAFQFCSRGIFICEENNFGDLLADFYNNVGSIYSVFNDVELAIRYYKRSLKLAVEHQNKNVELKTLINLAGICAMEGHVEAAKEYYGQMMSFLSYNSKVEYFGYLIKALILTAEGAYDEATDSFLYAVSYARKKQLAPSYISSVYSELASMYQKINRLDSALYYYNINTAFCKEHNLIYAQKENYKALVDLYSVINDKSMVDTYRYQYFLLSDSLMNADDFKQMKSALFNYELDKNHREIDTLILDKEQSEEKIRQQRTVLSVVVFVMLVFVALLLIVYRQKKNLHQAYQDLFLKNNEMLQAEVAHKELKKEYESLQKEMDVKNKSSRTYVSSKITGEQKTEILTRIIHVMEETEEFCDPDFSLEKLALLINSNSRYVSQIINETYDKNFRSFVNEYRIKKACLRLLDVKQYGNYTIKAIGESVGYKSYASFTDIFKKATGLLPSNYQKLAKAENRE